jgi:hypothetical protein
MSGSSQWKNFRVRGKYGKKNTVTHVTTTTPERAEKYADLLNQQRGGRASHRGKAEEDAEDEAPKKGKKP